MESQDFGRSFFNTSYLEEFFLDELGNLKETLHANFEISSLINNEEIYYWDIDEELIPTQEDLINKKEVTEIIHAGDPDEEGQLIIDSLLKSMVCQNAIPIAGLHSEYLYFFPLIQQNSSL